MSHEQIEHPSHYVAGEIEAWDVIWDHGFGYHLGNVVKYLLRAGNKGPAIDDLRKARQYLMRAIELTEADVDAPEELRPSYPAPDGRVGFDQIAKAFRLPGVRAMALASLCNYHFPNFDPRMLEDALCAVEAEIADLALGGAQ